MRDKKYYWTLAVLALLFLFVVLADVVGLIGLFTVDKTEEDVTVDAVVTVSAPADEDGVEAIPAEADDAPAEADDVPAAE